MNHRPRLLPILLSSLLLAGVGPAAAQSHLSGRYVFTCVNAAGRALTSDRLIADCMDREQRVLASDGTLVRIVPASLTADERAEKEARERRAIAEREAKAEAIRRDRNLIQRFPNASAHQKARDQALEVIQYAISQSQARVADLERERKPLTDESEFYIGKTLPGKLKAQLDANDAAAHAQKDLLVQQKAELDRVSKLYDIELTHLRRLWAGAAPGSLEMPTEPALAKAKPAATTKRASP